MCEYAGVKDVGFLREKKREIEALERGLALSLNLYLLGLRWEDKREHLERIERIARELYEAREEYWLNGGE